MTQADELAYRTASSAGPFAESLAVDCTHIAHAMRAGEVLQALATFEATADRLQRFLTYVVVTSEMLGAFRSNIATRSEFMNLLR